MNYNSKTKIKGSNLLDYVIPVAVFGVVFGIAIYNLHSTGLLQKFFRASTGGSLKGKSIIINQNNDFSPGFLNGTPTDPKMQCSSHSCAIDFGTYVLTGIPAESIDASTAGRGGELTTSYANVLEQIANQLAEKDPGLADIIRRLAEQGKKLAKDETAIEDKQRQVIQERFDYNDQVKKGTINLSSQLNSINPSKFDPQKDPYKIIAAIDNYVNKSGLCTYENGYGSGSLQKATKRLQAVGYAILEDANNLKPWEKQALQEIANFTYADDAKYLTLEQADILYNLSKTNLPYLGDYTQIVNKYDNTGLGILNNANLLSEIKTTGNGSGKKFKDLYTNELPKFNIDPSIKAVVDLASNQIMNIADGTFTVTISREEFAKYSGKQSVINSIVKKEIITEVAPAIVNEAKKIEESKTST